MLYANSNYNASSPTIVPDHIVKPRKLAPLAPGEEVVISGLAGRYADSDSAKALHDNLLSGIDLISDDDRRWKMDDPEIPKRMGTINNIEKFDSVFFGVNNKQAHALDPACRMLLEHAYEAVIDAGVNPRQLRGSKTGVFIGACFSESEKTWFYEKQKVDGFGILGCARSMLANRISYWFDIKGPSYTLDAACCSSFYALENAYRAITDGVCDAAIVGGVNLCLHPYVTMQCYKLGALANDGRCKTFDENADGYVRGEAISVIFLQKAKEAKRIYATVCHAKMTCDGFKEQGITHASSEMQSAMLKETYLECGISPSVVNYIEAHGTGTKVGDAAEVNSIDAIFGVNRTKENPLLIGAVKSNVGHAEPASGLVSLTKVLLSMDTGYLPPNLNYKNPRKDIRALMDGRIKVVTQVTPYPGEYAGVNSFGFGGVNSHVVLKMHSKTKTNNGAPLDSLPRLVAISGRSDEAVNKILKHLESKPVDVEFVKLFHDIHSEEINGHLSRGYTLLPPRGVSEFPIREIQSVSGSQRPVWFVFSGIGSQWSGMGKALLQIPTFAKAIEKCDAVLKPHGIDIYHVITSEDKTIFDNITNTFVGIAAIQIGLVDVLHSVGIEPDHMMGHSVGELGCAYADGCFTAEQMILSAYSRGLALSETQVIRGSMAAVGLGYEQLKPFCPADIDIACHNAANSATISGPVESMNNFIAELQAKNIFVREVPSSNIPYHSRYIASAGPKLFSYLQKIIPQPKPRSSKWLSTSVPEEKWTSPTALYSSAEYHTNNLLSPVLFEETSAHIPEDAIVIEIAPHGLLQAILKRSLDPNVVNIPLTQRGHSNNVEVLFQAIGKAFNAGLHPKLANLYPTVEYPVSRNTPMISPLIQWTHTDNWHVAFNKDDDKLTSGERTVEVSLSDNNFKFLVGHGIDGRNLFPAAGYIVLIWESLGMILDQYYPKMSVVFKDVKFLRGTSIPKTGEIKLTLTVQKGTGSFAVVEGGAAVVTGTVYRTKNPHEERLKRKPFVNNNEEIMNSSDIYKEMGVRGYTYTGPFRSMHSSTTDRTKGHLVWRDWVTFIDNMFQYKIFNIDTRNLLVTTGIKKLVIDVDQHYGHVQLGEEKPVPITFDKLHDVVSAAGMELQGLKLSSIAKRKAPGEPVIEEHKFIAFTDKAEMSIPDIARVSAHLALENYSGVKVKSIELVTEPDQFSVENLLSPYISKTFDETPTGDGDTIIYSTHKYEDDSLPSSVSVVDPKKAPKAGNAQMVIGVDLLTNNSNNLELLLPELRKGGFVVTRENVANVKDVEQLAQSKDFSVVLVKKYKQYYFIMLKKQDKSQKKAYIVEMAHDNFNWIETLQNTLKEALQNDKKDNTRVYIVGQGHFENGILGLINCLKIEAGSELIRGIHIQDPKAPKFDLKNPLYANQMNKDLTVSVLRENGVWGSYRYIPIPPLELKSTYHGFVNQTVRGDLSSFAWLEGPIHAKQDPKNIISIYYSSLNFRDVMLATGKLSADLVAPDRFAEECVIGFEYSGVDNSGKRIMGMLQSRAIANLCIGDSDLAWYVPDSWSLEDAATVPCVYATCYYGLYIKGKMRKGHKVLIHAGTGGIGQAAITLALQEGCEVFTTVGTPEKRKYIRDTFPQIADDHIGNSRDTSFEQMILEQTNGRGVDIVLNSLSEDKLLASVGCLAEGGQFLEIGKFDISANNPLGMECFLRGISFHGIHVDRIANADSQTKKELRDHMTQGLASGAIKPLYRTVFTKDQVEAAFRFMAAGKHMGKVVIKIKDENTPANTPVMAYPRYNCREDRSYIILGGCGGFGLELADWLISRGAKNVVLTSRSGLRSGYQKMRVELWKSYGVNVVIVAGKDAAVMKDAQSILETAAKFGPVDAIFNLAVVLRDCLFENQTKESFEESFRAKGQATKNMDILSRKLCPELRHFVAFSSGTCGRGNPGQTNYAVSNSVMERICEKRVSENLPGLAIQWGVIGDVGLVAELQDENNKIVVAGMSEQKISSCLHELDKFMVQNRPIVTSLVVADKKSENAGGPMSLIDAVVNIMGFKDLKNINMNTSFAEFGVDSMMSIELKQLFEREFDIFVTAQDLQALNFHKLTKMSDEKKAEK